MSRKGKQGNITILSSSRMWSTITSIVVNNPHKFAALQNVYLKIVRAVFAAQVYSIRFYFLSIATDKNILTDTRVQLPRDKLP